MSNQRFQKGSKRVSGFTLIELMVVLVLIGILSAMILPEMRGTYTDALLRSTSRDLVNLFELASSRAISLNQVHRVRLDRAAGKFWLERQEKESQKGGRFSAVKDIAGSEGKLDSRITIELRKADEETQKSESGPPLISESGGSGTESGEALSFFADGTTEQAEIRLRDRAGHGIGLRLNPITARVHIVELTRQ